MRFEVRFLELIFQILTDLETPKAAQTKKGTRRRAKKYGSDKREPRLLERKKMLSGATNESLVRSRVIGRCCFHRTILQKKAVNASRAHWRNTWDT